MNKILSENEGLERLLRINWNNDLAFDKSNLLLMREYFRRMRLWYRKLEPSSLPHLQSWAFFDIAAVIAPSIRANSEVISHFHSEVKLTSLTSSVCEWYLHWIALANTVKDMTYEIEEPYEP